MGAALITNLYVDGFNLYYRALKDTPFRWLDLRKLGETLFPEDSVHRVCYSEEKGSDVNLATRLLVDVRSVEAETFELLDELATRDRKKPVTHSQGEAAPLASSGRS